MYLFVAILCVWVFCLRMCTLWCARYLWGGGQKRPLGPLELELQKVLSCAVGAGNKAWVLCKSSGCSQPLDNLSRHLFVVVVVHLFICFRFVYLAESSRIVDPPMLLKDVWAVSSLLHLWILCLFDFLFLWLTVYYWTKLRSVIWLIYSILKCIFFLPEHCYRLW